MPKQKHTCCFILLFLLAFLTKGQFPQHFTYDNNNGLPSNEVYSILTDEKGFLWLGCDAGLYKFDAVRYISYRCATQKSRSVSGLTRSESGRLYCYNFQSQLFYIEEDSLKELSHSFAKISNISCNLSGQLLVNHQDGFAVYDEQQKLWKNFSNFGLDNPHTWKQYTRSVKVNSRNEAWFLCTSGLGIYSNNSLRFAESDLFTKEAVGSFILEYADNKAWIFSISKNRIYTSTGKTISEFKSTGLSAVLQGKKITHVKSLRDNKLWICTYSGLICYDIQRDSTTLYYPNLSFSDCLTDREGNYWFSTLQSGIIRVADLRFVVWNNFENKRLTKIADSPDHIFFSTVNGFIGCLNKQTQTLKLFDTKSNADIQCLNYEAEDKCLYFFTNTNLYALKNDRITLVVNAAPSAKYIRKIKGESFLCSSFGTYLFNLNSGKEIEKLNAYWSRKADYLDKTGDLWIASNEGLIQYRKEYGKWQQQKIHFPGIQIISSSTDPTRAKIFALTFAGKIYAVDTNGKQALLFTLPDEVQGYAIQYSKNCVYVATNKGLFTFNTETRQMQTLNLLSGLTSENIQDVCISRGSVFLATSQGLQKIPLSESKPRPASTVYIKNKKDPEQEILLSYQEGLVLLPEANAFSSNGKHRYAYRMKDQNSAWIELPGNMEKISIQNIPPGNFEIELKAIDHFERDSENTILLKGYVKPPFWQRWWFLLLLALLLFGLAYLAFRLQLNKRQKELTRQNELNASKLTALRSQMNPHFIFNALNSIQDLILKGDVENSYSYLTTFSNLVRKTLDFSDEDFIDFEQELKLTELYLSLEKLRFKVDLDYSIDPGNAEDILIPPLLIQPFIENALVHGLLHKEGEKILSIRFELHENLICIVQDNGIGREKARLIRQRQRSDHQSFSGKAIEKRFKILSEVFQGRFGYVYQDLEAEGKSTGTRVILTIPVKRKF